ncbi:BspA family leucine-rich repeat surface protein [Brachyspira hyodysenteriae]|nr:BspA family leucine-rich repeat surface protein [Brachyspira hyodysenteriae]MCZ9891239.1 BspA family leucine-rich repeat surface protein [Brachyspira hyodysenteriae]MCZ9988483.1 BspA family leucine-rich repeat surface protein [Brachyspira hyodysenteriae]MCZ9997146.1 BspA family leucine-rich repeat surface protein [Brachyspira hyodysenteriae]MDA0000584.1 BspA family leucine-rich repeat surface protein [Brachyspira hyodysenteriae]MDA0005588.1 BspA family leucine-rich repeat surface protein [B
MKKYKPTTKEELKRLVFTNNGIKLGDIDTSLITDMSDLFNESKRKDFDGIEEWDTSNVENMSYMFAYMHYNVLGQYSMTEFNSNLNNWNVSKVKNMIYMFAGCTYFNQPLNKWDVSNVENMSGMFFGAKKFNQPLNNWNVSKVKDMSDMFHNCEAFNRPLDKWDVSNVKDMSNMFNVALKFNQNINNWNVSNVEDLSKTFRYCKAFDQPLNDWDVSNVKNMQHIFEDCENFNQPLDKWDTSNVESMEFAFRACGKFNQPLNSWNMSKVTNIEHMFAFTEEFNQPLDKWDTRNVISVMLLFAYARKFDHYESLANWNLDSLQAISIICDDKDMDKLPTRIQVYRQAFFPKADIISITKFNVKEIYELIADDKNKKVVRLKKRLESDFSSELSFVTNNYNFKTIEKAEKYAERNYNAKKYDKKLEFIKNCPVLVKDKSREVNINLIKYIYSEYLSLKKTIKKLEKIDNMVNLLDLKSFVNFTKEIYLKNQDEVITAFVYAMYGGDEALKKISELMNTIESKNLLTMISFNIESRYAQSLLYKIYLNSTKSAIRKEAVEMINELLEKINIGYTEFRLRCMPNLGFNSKGEKELNKDYKLIVNNDYTLSLFDIKNNKELKKVPQNLDKKLKDKIKELSKEADKFINHSSHILSIMLIDGDILSYDLFKEVFIDNYLMNKFSSGLIWNLYDKDKNFVTTFRYTNDGNYLNTENEKIKINADNFMSLATPIEMDNETIDKWRKQLEDNQLSQAINQLTSIKLNKDNLKKEIKKIKNIDTSYGAFKFFAQKYDMHTNDVLGDNDTITYTFTANDGDIFSMSAKVDEDIEYDDLVNISIDFKKDKNKKDISNRFVYSFLIFIILDFRLTDLF